MEWAIEVENIKLEKIFPIEKHMPLVRNNKIYFPDRNGYLGVAEKNGSKWLELKWRENLLIELKQHLIQLLFNL